MRVRRFAGLGAGAVAGAALCALVTSGLLDATRVAPGLDQVLGPAPAAAADRLPAFTDCEELRQWYVDAALPLVGPWGFGGGIVPATAASADAVRGSVPSAQGEAVGSSGTGTNVQEAGVDEPDIVKTDGETLVRVAGRRGLEVYDVRGDEPRLLSRIRLPGRFVERELLLVGDTALVVGRRGYAHPWAVDGPRGLVPPSGEADTHLYQVDLSAPGAPVIRSHRRVEGSLVAAREYGDGVARVVVSTGPPGLDFVRPGRGRSPAEAERLNRRVVRSAGIEQWLPGIDRGRSTGHRPLLGCADVRHPETQSGLGTISVLTFDVEDLGDIDATAVTAAGDLAYSSADRLYVATLRSAWWGPVPLDASRRDNPPRPRTEVHAFALKGADTTYTASGVVRGAVKDRWSFDEHEGRLRVATALGHGWNPRENAVTVLEELGGALRVVGSVAGMGRRERIQSVRWFGDLAVLVTFRQVDPLYTVDLSDPVDPRVLDALKIRGFSDYLHPVGHGLLLGVGQDATTSGRSTGAQVALFDLTDLRAVARSGTVTFSRGTGMPVGSDPRTFTYLPDQRLVLAPVEDWHTGRSSLVALDVGPEGSLGRAGSWDLSGRWASWRVRTLPLGEGRVALVDREVRIIEVG